ncbi:Transcription factor grauzone, partial [Eumeta japonica]
MNHKKAANICHVCAKEIKDKHAFEKHVRLHFEDSGPRVKCPYPDCDSWLKDEDNLKSHLQRHNPEEQNQNEKVFEHDLLQINYSLENAVETTDTVKQNPLDDVEESEFEYSNTSDEYEPSENSEVENRIDVMNAIDHLQQHMDCGLINLNHHDPEEKRIHACEFCPKRFGRRQLLEVHRLIFLKKLGPLRAQSAQLEQLKEKQIFVMCVKEIKNKKAFEKHVRAHFEESGPRVKCTYPNCGRWLKDEDNLKTHMQLHNLAGKTYKCPECNKECPNRRALTNHRRYAHSNPNFRCEECHKTFKKAISLRELDENAANIKEESVTSTSTLKEEDERYCENSVQLDIDMPSNSKNPLDDCVDSDNNGDLENDCHSQECAYSELSEEYDEPEEKKKCVEKKNKNSFSKSCGSKTAKNVQDSKKKRISHR